MRMLFLLCLMSVLAFAACPALAQDNAAAAPAVKSAAAQDASPEAAATPAPVAKSEAAARKEIPDTPAVAKPSEIKTPIFIEHTGDDSLGARYAFHLKELFEKSSLFRLTPKDESKIKIILSTAEEFASRPNMSSIYGVVWSYSENEGTLKYFLASDVGVVHTASVRDQAELMASKTHEIVSKYAYLFE